MEKTAFRVNVNMKYKEEIVRVRGELEKKLENAVCVLNNIAENLHDNSAILKARVSRFKKLRKFYADSDEMDESDREAMHVLTATLVEEINVRQAALAELLDQLELL